ncbi:TetR/AcrR family transcriptional regulator [Sphingosinicella terrae]|uniref:TetR/AcrR family transcriptional regulator n=1 Tax=Sphingosinicella terrae TaxID=2172047 RepID=UPI0013B35F94|nr:TetR/AcrR family transcriptional regulator [Sphingosinicella terrae]
MRRRRGAGRPTREEGEKLAALIVGVATSLFLKHGYGGTSIDLIAERARISKGTFYTRFESKAAVFEAAMIEIARLFIPPRFVPERGEGPIATRLERLAENLLEIVFRPEVIALERVVTSEGARFPNMARSVHEKGTLEVVRRMTAFFADAMANGELKPGDPSLLAEQFLQLAAFQFLRPAVHGVGPTRLDAALRSRLAAVVQLFLNGCGADRAEDVPIPPT